MTGTIALHGGGEFLPGDEPFLRAILEAAPRSDGAVRAAVVPTAAGRGRPDLAAANGVAALTSVAAATGIPIRAEAVDLLERPSADDADVVAGLAAADLVHFPGGDPDLIPTILAGTAAWAAILGLLARGGVLAGASAGAMALGGWTWTPAGGLPGLGLVPGVVVVPHADAGSWASNLDRYGTMVPTGLALLGICERTGVLIDAGGGAVPTDGVTTDPWRVVGEGEVRWLGPGRRDLDATRVFHHGDTIDPERD